jgi:adenylate cyclase
MKQRLAAILAADAAGYSRLMAANESATIAALDAARAVFKSKIEANQGRVIDMAGDSVLAVFDTATGALSAALAVQEELKSQALALPEERRMCFRIGVHLGDVMEKADGTVYGDGVNIASRLQGLAEPGGITVSEAIHGVAKSRNLAFDDLGKQKVKNIAEPVQAFRARRGSTASRAPYRRIAAAIAAGMSVALVAAVLAWHRPWTSWMEKPAAPQAGLGLPAAPSIAVLPFENMGGDPEQSYFAEGGGPDHRPLQGGRTVRDRPPFDVRIQGEEPGRARCRQGAGGALRPGGKRAPQRSRRAHQRATHRCDDGWARMG